jgi:hypothetical protein
MQLTQELCKIRAFMLLKRAPGKVNELISYIIHQIERNELADFSNLIKLFPLKCLLYTNK